MLPFQFYVPASAVMYKGLHFSEQRNIFVNDFRKTVVAKWKTVTAVFA